MKIQLARQPSTAADAEWQILPAFPWEGDLNELDVNDGAPPHWMSRFVSERDLQARATWRRRSWGAETEEAALIYISAEVGS